MNRELLDQLAPTGTLRAGINLGNILLVTGRTGSGDPAGVSPDMARAIADRLGVPLTCVPFASPGEVADAVDAVTGEPLPWDRDGDVHLPPYAALWLTTP